MCAREGGTEAVTEAATGSTMVLIAVDGLVRLRLILDIGVATWSDLELDERASCNGLLCSFGVLTCRPRSSLFQMIVGTNAGSLGL